VIESSQNQGFILYDILQYLSIFKSYLSWSFEFISLLNDIATNILGFSVESLPADSMAAEILGYLLSASTISG
jgi:hypothetical protein